MSTGNVISTSGSALRSSGVAYVDAFVSATVAPLDALEASSIGMSVTGAGVTIENAGRYLVVPHGSLSGVSQNIEMKQNGATIYTFADDSNSSNGKMGTIVDVAAGDLFTLETSPAATWSNENTGSLALDANACRILVAPIG